MADSSPPPPTTTTNATTTLSLAACNQFGALCSSTAPGRCSGTWTFSCYPGVATSVFGGGVCARCLCNNATALVADLKCVDESGGGAEGVVAGGGVASVSTTSSLVLEPTASSINNSSNNNSNNTSSNNSYAMPLYITLTLLAVLCAGIAVYCCMKRKAAKRDREYKLHAHSPEARNYPQMPPSSPLSVSTKSISSHPDHQHKQGQGHSSALDASASAAGRKPLLPIWTTTTTTTTTSKDPKHPSDTTQTTTVTIAAFPPASAAAVAQKLSPLQSNQLLQDSSETTTTTVIHTPYLPSDSFLTPASQLGGGFGGNMSSSGGITLEEQWQFEQYQAAVQWHQWQLKQKEWQAEQRAYYLAKEEERKAKLLAEEQLQQQQQQHLQLPNSNQQPILSDSRKRTLGLLGYRPSPLRNMQVVRGDNESTLSRQGSRSSNTIGGRLSSVFDTLGSGGPGTGGFHSTMNSISRSSTVRSAASKSLLSTGTNNRTSMIVATSPEWSAPTDLVRVGSVSSSRTRESARDEQLDGLLRSTIEVDGSGLLSSSHAPNGSLVMTSTTFALGEDVSVVTMKSVGEDGSLITSQVLQVHYSSPTAGAGAASPSGSFDSHVIAERKSYDPSIVLSANSRMYDEPVSATAAGDALSIGNSAASLNMIEFDPNEIEEDMQMKYQVVKSHVPVRDDELALEVGDEVVVWRILEDGSCEGYCVGKKQRGFFPIKVVLG
ncbi:hypothetical protein BDR26DRAFT_871109 [Obelidium mucronatum]|nr:hypothetical protein BDR26DRAFT_871109 [Obelidium mucronatum]